MILGFAAGMPVVAAVAVWDRWNHIIHCPYCDEYHSHGGHGPSSPLGAIDDGRFTHCSSAEREKVGRGIRMLQEDGVLPEYYVLKEVPGIATFRDSEPHEGDQIVWEVTYDYKGIAAMRQEIAAMIAAYESMWEGPDRPRGGQLHPAQLAFQRGEIPWPAAYIPPQNAPIADPAAQCAIYLHFDANDVLLYVGITDDLVTRGRRHARRSTWSQFAVRGEVMWCANRAEAEQREAELIRERRPLFNDQHAAPDRDERLVAYLVRRGRFDLLAPAISRG